MTSQPPAGQQEGDAPAAGRRAHLRAGVALCALLALVGAAAALPAGTVAEQASQPSSAPAGQIDTGRYHTCAVLAGSVRCWGYSAEGELGYANTSTIGDNESPGSAGPVDLGLGRTATAVSAGAVHTCALLDDGTVRCWGYGADGRLGYANTNNVGDDETPGSVGPVDLGGTAKAISAGYGHTCALLEDGTVRCWGYAVNGALGYGNTSTIGDNETPAEAGSVKLGRPATAISAGQDFTCALLDNGKVRCWGFGADGRLGYGNRNRIGDDETPDSVGPVELGSERTAKAISAGTLHTCALLDNDRVRCWGYGTEGALGYANTNTIGDDETPAASGPVNLGRPATAISAGRYSCATLDDGHVRCWGANRSGQLGYGNTTPIGDDETPGSVGLVNLGTGRTAAAISVSELHTCARLDDGNVRCWGLGANGRLGYCNGDSIGDDETPDVAGPVALAGPSCTVPGGGSATTPLPGESAQGGGGTSVYPLPPRAERPKADPVAAGLKAQAARGRGLRTCRAKAARHAGREIRGARRLSGPRRARAKRHINGHRSQLRRRCLKRWGRTPGRVTGLKVRAVPGRKVVLTFNAPGTDGSRPPAARTYLVKQSRRPIRDRRGFRRAQTLCKGSCRFATTRVGATRTLTVGHLRPRTTYYYAVAARDNVSRGLGARSRAVKVRTP